MICYCEKEPFDDYLLSSEEEEMYDCCVESLRDARKKDCLDLNGSKIPNNDKCSKYSESFEKCFVWNGKQSARSITTTIPVILAAVWSFN